MGSRVYSVWHPVNHLLVLISPGIHGTGSSASTSVLSCPWLLSVVYWVVLLVSLWLSIMALRTSNSHIGVGFPLALAQDMCRLWTMPLSVSVPSVVALLA